MMSKHSHPFVLHTRVVTGTGGGPEKTILNSPAVLRRHGIDSACLFMRPPKDAGFAELQTRAEAADAEIIGVDDCGPMDRNTVRECIRICRERKVDIWHAHDYKSNAMGLIVRRFHPMKLVTTAHGWVKFTSRTPLYYWVDRFCMKRYDRVICVSPDLHQRCVTAGIKPQRLSLIDNAIVADHYDPAPATCQEKRRFGFDHQHILLGAVGRLSEEKGFHHLINAVSRLVDDGHNIGLLIAGEGDCQTGLQKQIDEHGLGPRVRLVGFLSDPRHLYRAIDLFVLSSLREGLPNVVLEAMASQRTVVSTRVNGIPGLVQDQVNGVVVGTDSEEELRKGIEICIRDDTWRQQLAANGRQTIVDRFSFEQRMARVVSVYHDLSDDFRTAISSQHSPGTANARCDASLVTS